MSHELRHFERDQDGCAGTFLKDALKPNHSSSDSGARKLRMSLLQSGHEMFEFSKVTVFTNNDAGLEVNVAHHPANLEYTFGCFFSGPNSSKKTFIRNARSRGLVPPSTPDKQRRLSFNHYVLEENSGLYYTISIVLLLDEKDGDLIILPRSKISFCYDASRTMVRQNASSSQRLDTAASYKNVRVDQTVSNLTAFQFIDAIFDFIPNHLCDLAEATGVEWGNLKLTKGGVCTYLPVSVLCGDDMPVVDAIRMCQISQRHTLRDPNNLLRDHRKTSITDDGVPLIRWRLSGGGYITQVRPKDSDMVKLEVYAPNVVAVRELISVNSGIFCKETASDLSWNLMITTKPIIEATTDYILEGLVEDHQEAICSQR